MNPSSGGGSLEIKGVGDETIGVQRGFPLEILSVLAYFLTDYGQFC